MDDLVAAVVISEIAFYIISGCGGNTDGICTGLEETIRRSTIVIKVRPAAAC
jgi:hypothetical protein